jgi:hypothetical protein
VASGAALDAQLRAAEGWGGALDLLADQLGESLAWIGVTAPSEALGHSGQRMRGVALGWAIDVALGAVSVSGRQARDWGDGLLFVCGGDGHRDLQGPYRPLGGVDLSAF